MVQKTRFWGPGFETIFQEVKKVVNLPLIYSNFWVRGVQLRYSFFRSPRDPEILTLVYT